MPDLNLPPDEQPDHFAEIAASLYRIADDIVTLTGSGLPVPSVQLSIQPGGRGDDDPTARAVDAVTSALLGHPGQLQLMTSGDVYHYNNGDSTERVGAVDVRVMYSVSTEWALKRKQAAELAEREVELEKLRAEVAELRAAQSGFGYSREADDPTPVSPGRMPLHTGGVIDGGALVDETEAEPVHYRFGRNDTACGLKPGEVPAATADHVMVTCKACIDEMPF